MDRYYFAFKVNPINVIQCNFPRPQSQDYGVVCANIQDAHDWLKQADIPEHQNDWLYSRYKLPALDIIITAAPVSTVNTLPQPQPGTPVPVFAHAMRNVDVTSMYISIAADEVHGTHMMGSAQGKDFSSENLLLRNASSEMLNRMVHLEEFHQACNAHPDIPREALQTWGRLMFEQGVHHHDSVKEYFAVFAEHYKTEHKTQDVVREMDAQSQDAVKPGVILTIESAARYLYSELYNNDANAFERILDNIKDDARPYLQARFMQALEPDNYKELFMEEVPQSEREAVSKLWDSTLIDLRLSNQVELRTGAVRIQDLTLQTAIHVCTEMEYTAFRTQSGTQHTYSMLRSAAVQDEVKLEMFDNPEIDELENEID